MGDRLAPATGDSMTHFPGRRRRVTDPARRSSTPPWRADQRRDLVPLTRQRRRCRRDACRGCPARPAALHRRARARRQRRCRAVSCSIGQRPPGHHYRGRPRAMHRNSQLGATGLPSTTPVRMSRRGRGRWPRARSMHLPTCPAAACARAPARPAAGGARLESPPGCRSLHLYLLLDANITFHGLLIQERLRRTRALAACSDRLEFAAPSSALLPLEASAEAPRPGKRHAGGKIVLDVTSSLDGAGR